MSYKACASHTRKQHNRRDLLSMLTVTNQCPWCMSTFLTREIAVGHVRGACAEGGGGREGLSSWAKAAKAPASNDCLVCEHQAFCLEHLQVHVRSHHPGPETVALADHGCVDLGWRLRGSGAPTEAVK